MHVAAALTEPGALLRLIGRLEPHGRAVDQLRTSATEGGLVVPSPNDPGVAVAFVVARETPNARNGGEKRWWSENRQSVEHVLTALRVSDCTVLFPGNWPAQPWRSGTGQNVRVRLISATYHLWADRLKRYDRDTGDLDLGQIKATISKLAGQISSAEEKRYTQPSLQVLDETDPAAKTAMDGLLAVPADPHAGLTVLFGPGGIGKTFFLKRLSDRLGRQAVHDHSVGIPVYAALPLLLHSDALENWISAQDVRLPLDAIRILIEEGIFVPILDALDELVRGQAREGSRQFLGHLAGIFGHSSRGVLSSRDYYRNIDPLLQSTLSDTGHYLAVGFFDKSGRRRYIQVRTGLSADHAARWATKLDSQATEALDGASDSEIETLVGHPLFLDAFCQMINSIPPDRRAVEVDVFRLRSPDIFGEIVERVLEREHVEKFRPSWETAFGPHLLGRWKDPFTPALQRALLRELVLAAARSGGASALNVAGSDKRYQNLRHGLFVCLDADTTETNGRDEATNQTIVEVVRSVLGSPQVEPGYPDQNAEALLEHAMEVLVESIRSHTLADTQGDHPDSLVFATRHRAYFDYLLAEAVLERLLESLPTGIDDSFILWCIEHRIIEREENDEAPTFATCLDFALWHRKTVGQAIDEVESYLDSGADRTFSAEIASYLCSFALALAMRKGARQGPYTIAGVDVAADRRPTGCTIRILPEVIPSVQAARIESCAFPRLVLHEVDLRDVVMTDCSARSLDVADCRWRSVEIEVHLEELSFGGTIDMTDCTLNIRGPGAGSADIRWAPGLRITLQSCTITPELHHRLSEQAALSPDSIVLDSCTTLDEGSLVGFSAGRRFANKLTRLVRKHGHPEFGVFRSKLQGQSNATANSFADALEVLARHDVIASAHAQMIKLTKLGESVRFTSDESGRSKAYHEVAAFWDPVVRELDEVFGDQ